MVLGAQVNLHAGFLVKRHPFFFSWYDSKISRITHPKANMTMEKLMIWRYTVSPIEHGDFHCHVIFGDGASPEIFLKEVSTGEHAKNMFFLNDPYLLFSNFHRPLKGHGSMPPAPWTNLGLHKKWLNHPSSPRAPCMGYLLTFGLNL